MKELKNNIQEILSYDFKDDPSHFKYKIKSTLQRSPLFKYTYQGNKKYNHTGFWELLFDKVKLYLPINVVRYSEIIKTGEPPKCVVPQQVLIHKVPFTIRNIVIECLQYEEQLDICEIYKKIIEKHPMVYRLSPKWIKNNDDWKNKVRQILLGAKFRKCFSNARNAATGIRYSKWCLIKNKVSFSLPIEIDIYRPLN